METTPRDRLVQATARLLQSQGYYSTGLNQILQESGVPKGSLYHYFPGGKEDLAVDAIAYASTEIANLLQDMASQALPLLATLGGVIDFFANELQSSQFLKGCPVATITLEQAGASSKIQAACEAAYARWQAGLAALLGAHHVQAPDRVAQRLLVALEGALLVSRARRHCGPMAQLKTDLPMYLQTQEPQHA